MAVVVTIKSVGWILLSALGRLQIEYDKFRLLSISLCQGLRARFPITALKESLIYFIQMVDAAKIKHDI